MIVGIKLGHHQKDGEKPICEGCGKCCYFREDGGPLTKCRHLENNRCLQYEARPDMCKKWWCEESFKRGAF